MATANDHEQHGQTGHDPAQNPVRDSTRDSTRDTTEDRLEVNKKLVSYVLQTVTNDKNLARIEDEVAFDGAVGRVLWLFTALPDARITIDWQVAEGEWVVTGATFRGTQSGEWEGLPPTGKHVTLQATFRDQVVDGKIVRHEALYDLLAALEQIGAQLTLGHSN